jgi:hypothetical protein
MTRIFGGDSLDTNHTRKIYNNFVQKDMTFEDFHRELNACVNPIKMEQDLDILLKSKGRAL